MGGTVLEFFEDVYSDTCPIMHTHTQAKVGRKRLENACHELQRPRQE